MHGYLSVGITLFLDKEGNQKAGIIGGEKRTDGVRLNDRYYINTFAQRGKIDEWPDVRGSFGWKRGPLTDGVSTY